MSKICGVVAVDPRFDAGRHLKEAYDASWQEGYVRRELWAEAGAGLGHMSVGAVNLDEQPLLVGEGAVVYCGKIFDYGKLQEELERDGAVLSPGENDARFVAELLARRGACGLSRANGIFSLAVWKGTERRLTLACDRYGLRSLYYHHDPARGILVFASELRGVMASGLVPRRIHWPACSNFLYFGHHLGDSTWFRDVQLMPPGTVLTFEDNEVRIEPYWSLNSIGIEQGIDYPTVLEECIRLFQQAIHRQNVPTAGAKTVFLSGGLDSRRIAAELKRQGADFDTYTTGWDESSADPNVARVVAGALGIANTLIRLPERRLMVDYWPRSNALVDYETKLHQWILPLVEALPAEIKVNYDGLAGDIPFNGMRRGSPFADADRFRAALSEAPRTLADRIVGPEMPLSIFSRSLRDHLSREHVVASVEQELNKYGHTSNCLAYFYLMNRTRRAIALSPYRLVLLKAETFLPFLDNDLFTFVMSVPIELKMVHRLRHDMVDAAYPELAGIGAAVERDGRGKKVGWQHNKRYLRQRREYFIECVFRYYLKMNWAFDNRRAGPRIAKDMMNYMVKRRHISYVFSEGFSTFYDFLRQHSPQGIT